ncbi:uncharacterized protein A4U43_C04F2920 [Asparagus officinalis]|uniref:3'-5' exonuclease n=1 Tax=Asparagus officinalis TaxID=4686 RepID=A0A5P1EYH8_ASPOF|nr:Werner Syndrome-like exonuclease [Asparagus officinalis]ONK70924.1 uncharacterized protein A4U43_C04F2920 [Asparagus officinalis]
MESETGENEEGGPSSFPLLDWDRKAEEELRSIEESYANSKRKNSSPNLDLDVNEGASDQRRSKGRRLPSWAKSSASSAVSTVGSCQRSWAPSPSPCRSNLKMKRQRMNFGGRIVYCRTFVEAEQAAVELFDKIKARKRNEGRISVGFDIEWRPTFRQGEAPTKAALMQICMDNSHCYVIHIIHSGIPPSLKCLLEDLSSIKVGVWIANDAMKMSKDYNVNVEPLDDLSEYANLKLGGAKRWSLSSLTEMLTCKELAKPPKIRMGDWEAIPLSREQLQYAATDAFASWYLYEVLKTFPDLKPETENIIAQNDVAP